MYNFKDDEALLWAYSSTCIVRKHIKMQILDRITKSKKYFAQQMLRYIKQQSKKQAQKFQTRSKTLWIVGWIQISPFVLRYCIKVEIQLPTIPTKIDVNLYYDRVVHLGFRFIIIVINLLNFMLGETRKLVNYKIHYISTKKGAQAETTWVNLSS